MKLPWLPPPASWADTLARAAAAEDTAAWDVLVAAANHALDASRTNRLDRLLQSRFATAPPGLATRPVRLAILASSTVAHLIPAIRVGALRRGLWVEVYAAPYGAYRQDLLDPASGLHAFAPDTVLFALDTPALTRPPGSVADALVDLRGLWRRARAAFGCPVIQQTLLPVAAPLLGSNEHRLPGSAAASAARLNGLLRGAAEEEGVDLLALDALAGRHGLDAWHDPVWWLRAKQEVSPAAAPLYGDHVARLLAARQGLSKKCLVLDLDNTLWGGVVGDDGVAGLALGQGSAEGEAFLSVQAYARDLAARGVILAVVSKNDERNALEAFETHPEMLLRRADFAAFLANWDDKAQNLRRVAATIGIGLDSLVFVDDNPFERELVRAELPMVAVPELPEDPARYASALAEAGYFEALHVTAEDRERGRQYAANAARSAAEAEAADLPAYLASLGMRLLWRSFDRVGLGRIVQLVNKTNQFNLTTRRVTEEETLALMERSDALCLQFRLLDRFGDSGTIGIVVAEPSGAGDLALTIWLMSCRVLGRQVEAAMLAVVAGEARRLGARRLVGLYRPSPKNGMVRGLYPGFGFRPLDETPDGTLRFVLDLDADAAGPAFVAIEDERAPA